MRKGYLGVDIGSISTKGLVIDESNNIIAESYIWTEGNPIAAVKTLIANLKKQIKNMAVVVKAVGTTGSARKLIGTMLNAQIVKNEITAHAIGTLSIYPDVRTIFEIGRTRLKNNFNRKRYSSGLCHEYAMRSRNRVIFIFTVKKTGDRCRRIWQLGIKI